MTEHGITLAIDDAVIIKLAEEGYSQEFGARPLKRTIHNLVTVPISQHMLKHPDAKKLRVKRDKGFHRDRVVPATPFRIGEIRNDLKKYLLFIFH